MAKIFNTNIEDFEIIDTIIDYLDDNDINDLIDSNIVLRFQFRPNKKKIDRSIINQKIKQIYKKDITLKREIVNTWNFNIVSTQSEVRKAKDIDKYIQNIVDKNISLEIFENCTILWKESDKELNKRGDNLYEEYKRAFEEESNEIMHLINGIEEEVSLEMDNDIMNTSIGEFIKKITTSTIELENLKKKLDDKEKENKELYKSLESVTNNKDLKKEIKILNKKLVEIQSEVINKNIILIKEINELKEENKNLINNIKNIIDFFNKFNVEDISKSLMKNIIDVQTNMNNSLKGGIIESINKNIDNRFKNLEEKINNMANEKETIIATPENKENEIKHPITETYEEGTGLAKILEELDTIL